MQDPENPARRKSLYLNYRPWKGDQLEDGTFVINNWGHSPPRESLHSLFRVTGEQEQPYLPPLSTAQEHLMHRQAVGRTRSEELHRGPISDSLRTPLDTVPWFVRGVAMVPTVLGEGLKSLTGGMIDLVGDTPPLEDIELSVDNGDGKVNRGEYFNGPGDFLIDLAGRSKQFGNIRRSLSKEHSYLLEGNRKHLSRAITFQTLPAHLTDLFLSKVKTARDAIDFFSQHSGELDLASYFERPDIGMWDKARVVGLGVMSDPDVLAEDIATFGLLNVAGKAITFGKHLVGQRQTIAVVNNAYSNLRTGKTIEAGTLLTGSAAARAVTSGNATVPGLFTRLGLRYGTPAPWSSALASAKEIPKATILNTHLPLMALWTTTDQGRWHWRSREVELTLDKEFLANSIYWSAGAGFLGGGLLKWQLNGMRNLRMITDAQKKVAQNIMRATEDGARKIGKSMDELSLEEMTSFGQRALNDMANTGFDGLETGMQKTLLRRMSHFMFRSPESIAYLSGNKNFQRVMAKISDNMALPDHLTVGSDLTSDVFSYVQQNNGALVTLTRFLTKAKGPRIDKNWVANMDSLMRTAGEVAMTPGDMVQTVNKIASRMGWSPSSEQVDAVLNAAEVFRLRTGEINRLFADTGGFNVGFTGMDELHVARKWRGDLMLENKDDAIELFTDYFLRKEFPGSQGRQFQRWADDGIEVADVARFQVEPQMYDDAIRDATEVVANFTSMDTSASSSFGAMGTSQHKSRVLTLPTDFTAISPRTGQQIRALDYIDTHPGSIMKELNTKIGPQVFSALKNHDPIVRQMLREASEALKAGDLAKAKNYNEGARIAEFLSNTGRGGDVETLKAAIRRLNDNAEELDTLSEARAVMERIVDSNGNLIPMDRTNRAYEDAVLQAFDLAHGTNSLTQVNRLRRTKGMLLEQQDAVKWPKNYAVIESLPLPIRGVFADALNSGAISPTTARLVNSALSHLRSVGEDGSRFTFRMQEFIDVSRRFSGGRILGPLDVNSEALKRARMARSGVGTRQGIGKAVWRAEEVNAIREGASALWFHLPLASRNAFKSMFSHSTFAPGELGMPLAMSSLGRQNPLRANTHNELFMEAVVRHVAGDDSLSGFSNMVTDIGAFKSFVKRYSDGFLGTDQAKTFFGVRPGRPNTRATSRLGNSIEVIDSEIDSIFRTADHYVSSAGRSGQHVVEDILRGVAVHGSSRTGVRANRTVADNFAVLGEDVVSRAAARDSMGAAHDGVTDSYQSTQTILEGFRTATNKWIVESRRNLFWRQHVDQEMKLFDEVGEFIDPMDARVIRELDGDSIKADIVKSGPAAYQRARDFMWDKWRIIKEGVDNNQNLQATQELVQEVEKLRRRYQGIAPMNPEGMTTRRVGQFLTKVLYANAAVPLMLTQLHDIAGPMFVSGMGGWLKYLSKMMPLFLPGAITTKKVLGRRRLARNISVRGPRVAGEGDDIGRGRTGATGRRVVATGMGPRSETVRMSEDQFRLLAEDSHQLSGAYPELASLDGDLSTVTGRYLNASAPTTAAHWKAGAVNSGVSYVARKIEDLSDTVIQYSMHEVVKRTRIAATIFAADTLPDVIRSALKGDETSKSLLLSLRIGDDNTLSVLKKQLRKHGDDFTTWDTPERLLVRSAIARYTNNLTIAPSYALTPGIFDTPLGRVFLQFKRFLLNAPQKYLPNAMKRGGPAAVIGSMMGVTAWGMMVEGAVKPYLKGRGVWDGWKRDMDTWTTTDWMLVGRIINSSGQFGYLPESILAMDAFDPSRVPAIYSIVRGVRGINKGIDQFDAGTVVSGLSSLVGLQTLADMVKWRRNFLELEKERKIEGLLRQRPLGSSNVPPK